MPLSRLITCLIAACWLSACAVHERIEEPPLQADMAPAFSIAGEADAPGAWHEAIEDPALQELIEQALSSNLTIRQAWARLAQANALARQAGVLLYPQANFNLETSRIRTEAQGFSQVDSNHLSSLITSYEVDLWKRIESQQDAALLDAAAAQADWEATRLAIETNLAQTWYALIEQRARLALLDEQVETSSTFLELIELRFSQGRATAVAVFQQRQQLTSIESEIPLARSLLDVFEHQMAVLLGRDPVGFSAPEGERFPALPPLPHTGAPADLLQRRPDVRAALQRVYAADARIGAAIADQYPALSLTARTSFQNSDPADLFQNWLLTLAANLTTPILDGGRRKAEIDRSRAALDERIAGFEQSVLTAIGEVENALAQEARQRDYLKSLETELNHAREAYDEARNRFRQGIGDYLTTLTALQSMQRVERTLIAAESGIVSYRIDLYKALGGHWSASRDEDVL